MKRDTEPADERLAVIVPVLNEQEALPAFLAAIDAALAQVPGAELIFSDGGSTDATPDVLAGRHVIHSERGRARQCAAGLHATDAQCIVFLHADEIVSPSALLDIVSAFEGGAMWGCLKLRWSAKGIIWRIGETMSNMRAGVAGIPFGDQGMFMRRGALEAVGGIPDLPIMQDYELSRRLRARFGRPRQLAAKVVASPRRFQEGGPVRVALQMYRLRAMYRKGVDPRTISERYRDVR